jgi:uncharacterized protein YjbI with pentapeptide repeats
MIACVIASKQCTKCCGARLEGDHCLAHLSDREFKHVLERLRNGEPLNASHVHVTAQRLKDLLDGLHADDRRPQLSYARFEGAYFTDGAAHFERTRFLGDAHFEGARFAGDAHFDGAHFDGDAHFDRAQFPGEADFRKVQFSGEADLRRVFAKKGRFDEAQFFGEARFDRAGFSEELDLQAGFRRRSFMGRVGVAGKLVLDDAVFDEDVRLDATARNLSCVRTRFSGRADLNVCWAAITLEEATFAYRSRLNGVATPPAETHHVVVRAWEAERETAAPVKPPLESIRQANVENVGLHNVDLRSCRFFGAHGLDQMSINLSCIFPYTPSGRRYTRRRIVPEERELRWPGAQPSTAPQGYGDVASIYRSLRKALEDHKDEPGAADFYYGEMEMRRLSPRPDNASLRDTLSSLGERLVLRLYWLVSGYGLRASRAFAALLVTVLLFAVAFYLWGFTDEPFWRALLFSAQSTTSLFKAPDEPRPEPVGEALQLMLRVLGPLFFGLALLSLRGRVKR